MIGKLKNLTSGDLISRLPQAFNNNNRIITAEFDNIFDSKKNILTKSLVNEEGIVKTHTGQFINLIAENLSFTSLESLLELLARLAARDGDNLVIKVYEASEDKRLESLVDELETQYDITKKDYNAAIALYGKDSEKTKFYYNEIIDISNKLMDAKKKLEDSSLDDNVIFLFLIPDIKKRIDSTSNYFTAPERVFELTEDEQLAIIDLIEQTCQRVITLENKIVRPLYPRFAVNINIRRWSNVNEVEIYNNILYYLSDYFINNERRDRIPQSDLIRIIEMIPGVDSVNLKFDADRNNINVYGDSYGIDEYGDVLLSRFTTDYFGNEVEIKDIYPLFRGGFINKNSTEYSNVQQLGTLSAVNVNFIGVTEA